jgi:hypothetical protein
MTVKSFRTEPFVVPRRRVTALLRDVTGMTQSCQGCVTIDDITAGMVVANGDIAIVFSGSYGFALLWACHTPKMKCFTAVLEKGPEKCLLPGL